MKKHVTKIICATLASVVALGVASAAGCSTYNKGVKLDGDYSAGKVESNGGFAVEKGNYVYFINGPESNTAENTFGTPVKGSILRIAKTDLAAYNYSSVETVVPQVVYSGDYSTGIFVYGDYIYYSTPSTTKTSDGVVQNGNLDLKRTKLDGTESMKDAFITFPSLSYDFRFVEGADGVVYILYVATESLFDESTAVKNIHSVNTSTGEDKVLAYNVSSYLFDAENKSNPRMYYTMAVRGTATGSNEKYNQIYTVTADQTKENEYDTASLSWWNEETDRYINCGTLVLDGIGQMDETTPFNKAEAGKNVMRYSYTLETYLNGTLFYTRVIPSRNTSAYLFSETDAKATAADRNPVESNHGATDGDQILDDGTSAEKYKYLFNEDGSLKAVLAAESGGGISINYVKDGKLATEFDKTDYFRIVGEGSATLLHVDEENEYLYYSLTGGNGYTFYRVSYTGSWGDYNGLTAEDTVDDCTPVRILDLDSVSDWYMPEFIGDTILFASETDSMTVYNYIMAFNLEGRDNAAIDELNKLYKGINGTDGIIPGYAKTDDYPSDLYANLANAARYLFYTADKAYIDELAPILNAENEDADPVYSENTLKKLEEFMTPTADNDWADYTATRKVNGKDVYANRRDYYYSVVGKMTEADCEGLRDAYRSSYLRSPAEKEEVTWYQSLSTVERVFFIIGMCLAGILVLGGITVGVILIVRKVRGKKLPQYTKRRIKVDTTDDKSVDVYADETSTDGTAE